MNMKLLLLLADSKQVLVRGQTAGVFTILLGDLDIGLHFTAMQFCWQTVQNFHLKINVPSDKEQVTTLDLKSTLHVFEFLYKS